MLGERPLLLANSVTFPEHEEVARAANHLIRRIVLEAFDVTMGILAIHAGIARTTRGLDRHIERHLATLMAAQSTPFAPSSGKLMAATVAVGTATFTEQLPEPAATG